MFTGIVECTGKIISVVEDKGNRHFTVEAPFGNEVTIDQSIAHDGVCLTTVNLNPQKKQWTVTAIKETLDRSHLGTWKEGYEVNLERCLKLDGRLDGHIVQGHVDTTAVCTEVLEADGSWYYAFEYKPQQNHINVQKGSVTVNGVSLTVIDPGINTFKVAIIPFTHTLTNFHNITVGTKVNIEFDIVGKYIAKMLEAQAFFKNL